MARAVPTPPEEERPVEERSVPGLLREIVQETGDLIQQEFQLLRQEISDTIRQTFLASGVLIAGIVTLILGAGFLGFTLIQLLALVMLEWVAALIVTVVFLAVGAGLVYWGINRFNQMQLAPQTVDTLKEDAEWLKHPTKPDVK